MKTTSALTLALLIEAAEANTVGSWYVKFPAMLGTIPTITNTISGGTTNANFQGAAGSGTECVTCIRAGWVWCSAKWNYELPYSASSAYITAVDGTNVERGNCCY